MAKLIILALIAATAFAADIDFSKVRPRDLKRGTVPSLRYPSHGRITGGKEAGIDQFPYQVGMFLQASDGTYFCGGSVISDIWVLTAAHCVDGISSATIKFGAHNIREDKHFDVEVSSKNFIIHESWDSARIKNDIALIRLPEPIKFDEKVQPVLLPRAADASNTFTSAQVVASGWGKDSDGATGIASTLRYVESTVQSLFLCKISFFGNVADENICMSTSGGKSTCNGDSGGPLVTSDVEGKPVMIGATSFGSGLGCEAGFPAVFTRIGAYLSWINQKTGIPLRQ